MNEVLGVVDYRYVLSGCVIGGYGIVGVWCGQMVITEVRRWD